MSEVVRLEQADWDLLLPGKEFPLANKKLWIRPLGLEELGKVLAILSTCKGELESAGVDEKNFNEPANLLLLTKLMIEHLPHIMADSCGVHVDDLKRLPIGISVQLIAEIIAVNMTAHEGLEKNLQALVGTMGTLKAGVSGTLPNS